MKLISNNSINISLQQVATTDIGEPLSDATHSKEKINELDEQALKKNVSRFLKEVSC